ncbi:protein Wnt-16-like isoform X2 [Physella acuta]|uniref:protein Wnt-16-like isoform X2 n=1 Tax=Physella acuta TaxID=109671 RepID=UPI0027DC71D7|nr:protein Wnt-16-like isoform X2 [Physella acuta]
MAHRKTRASGDRWIVFILGIYWILLLKCGCFASWMYLGVASLAGSLHDSSCNEVPGLVHQQLQVCKDNPQSLMCISEGAKRGILECQSQFRFERWNCTTQKNYTVFGPILRKGTRETAFVYAVLSAGVVHSVTQACSVGNLTDCSCDMSRYGEADVEGWKWGGCSDNVNYGLWFSKTFVDAPETVASQNGKNVRNLMNLHNNEVGRKVVEKLMSKKCRCHGVSGSCAVKTCWRGLPAFKDIGQSLKSFYETSVRLAGRSKQKLRRKEKSKRRVPISTEELVYLSKSPNYCKHNPTRGILGTTGRVCNRTSEGPEGCNLLCCGRGYNTQVVKHVERCHCKFHYCCYVECKSCATMVDIHTCK